jgi:hypothetical protein
MDETERPVMEPGTGEVMTIKKCSCCHVTLTTKTVVKIGRQNFGAHDILYMNCKLCGSTVTLVSPPVRQKTA